MITVDISLLEGPRKRLLPEYATEYRDGGTSSVPLYSFSRKLFEKAPIDHQKDFNQLAKTMRLSIEGLKSKPAALGFCKSDVDKRDKTSLTHVLKIDPKLVLRLLTPGAPLHEVRRQEFQLAALLVHETCVRTRDLGAS